MNFATFFRFLPFCFFALTVVAEEAGSSTDTTRKGKQRVHKKKYVIDSDAGADDAIAILYILGWEKLNQNIKTVAITCANGNTVVDNVVVNVLKTLKTANRLDIPVFRGASEAILTRVDADDYFGEDGFGDFEFEDPPSPSLARKKHAVNALVNLVRKNPGEISLICLAPLTNIALAVRMYPDFLRDVKEVFVFGGAVEGNGYMKPGIEFNFYVDPEAAFIVLRSAKEVGKKITLMPSEASILRGSLPMEWRLNVLGALDTPGVNLINNAERKTLTGDTWMQADQLLAAVALNESLIASSVVHPVEMETCGKVARGSVFVDYANKDGNSTVRIVKDVKMEECKKLLLKYLNVTYEG